MSIGTNTEAVYTQEFKEKAVELVVRYAVSKRKRRRPQLRPQSMLLPIQRESAWSETTGTGGAVPKKWYLSPL